MENKRNFTPKDIIPDSSELEAFIEKNVNANKTRGP